LRYLSTLTFAGPYCWFGPSNVFAPYYGAYFAASALANSDSFAQIDDSSSPIAVYAFFQASVLHHAVIINTQYHVNGTRPSSDISITSLPSSVKKLSIKRLVAPASTSLAEQGQAPTFYGHRFSDTDCTKTGTDVIEVLTVSNGAAMIAIDASEAVLIEW
jgi:hypothetical protein